MVFEPHIASNTVYLFLIANLIIDYLKMIESKQDLYTYLDCDKIVYGGKKSHYPTTQIQHFIWMTREVLKDFRCDYK